MKIGVKEYSQIIIMDEDKNLLASISDEDVISDKDIIVVCVPSEI